MCTKISRVIFAKSVTKLSEPYLVQHYIDLEVKLSSKLKNKHSIRFVVFMLVENDVSLVVLERLMLGLLDVMVFFKRADGDHLRIGG